MSGQRKGVPLTYRRIQSATALVQRSSRNRITSPPHLIFDNMAHATVSLIFDCRLSSELRMPSLAWMKRVTPNILLSILRCATQIACSSCCVTHRILKRTAESDALRLPHYFFYTLESNKPLASSCPAPDSSRWSCSLPEPSSHSQVLSVVHKLFRHVSLNRIDEGQPCEQAGFRRGFSTIVSYPHRGQARYVSREYKTPLCLTFIDLKKAFDSVETEAVIEALCKQGVSTQYVKIPSELYKGFTTVITLFYNNFRINVKRGVRQGDTTSPKLFNASLENIMRTLEWDDMGVKIDGRQLHHLRFADDIVLITPYITQAERMLADFDHACGKIGLQLNLTKTLYMRNGYVSDA
ncbi:hypothetical protein Q1695_012539 [Nippostrongylus brasiliensis]|nr:hypothetical protein Q1695_012539 [Nippostrongylus brasiliensis]